MAKKLASKITKEIFNENEIKEKKLNKGEFTPSWKGRVYILDPEKAQIAKKMGITKAGEYAIKVR